MSWDSKNINNPNNSPNPIQKNINQSEQKVNYNRAHATRRDTDTQKNFTVTLLDIDTAIVNTLSDTLKLQVMDNGESVKVPVVYGNPERWFAMKQQGGIRDNQGKILLPALMIRRKSVENNKELATFNRYLTYQTIMGYTEKNKYDRFDLLNRDIFQSKPTKQILSVTLPTHVNISYECIIWTDYVDQNNKLLEQINFASKDYWGDRERFKFRTRIDNYSIDQELNDGEDRNVKTTFDLIVNAYLLNDTIVTSMSGVKNTTNKIFTVRKIKLDERLVGGFNNTSQKKYQDTTHVVDKNTDFEYVNDIGIELKNNDVKNDSGYNKIPNQNVVTTMFHPAPKSVTEYGEDGWLAYDDRYIYVYKYPSGWLKREISTFDYDYTTQQYISGYDCNNNPIYTTQNKRPINTAFRVFQRFPEKIYHQVPYQSSDYGQDGWISYDGLYFYIYSNGQWRRVPISLFNPMTNGSDGPVEPPPVSSEYLVVQNTGSPYNAVALGQYDINIPQFDPSLGTLQGVEFWYDDGNSYVGSLFTAGGVGTQNVGSNVRTLLADYDLTFDITLNGSPLGSFDGSQTDNSSYTANQFKSLTFGVFHTVPTQTSEYTDEATLTACTGLGSFTGMKFEITSKNVNISVVSGPASPDPTISFVANRPQVQVLTYTRYRYIPA